LFSVTAATTTVHRPPCYKDESRKAETLIGASSRRPLWRVHAGPGESGDMGQTVRCISAMALSPAFDMAKCIARPSGRAAIRSSTVLSQSKRGQYKSSQEL